MIDQKKKKKKKIGTKTNERLSLFLKFPIRDAFAVLRRSSGGERMSSSMTMFSHHYSRARSPGGGPVGFGFGFKDDFALCSRRSGRPDGSTMKSSSASRKQRPRRARATKRTRISAAIARDLAEGDEGIDVELLQKDLTEEGLLDRKHANGYVCGPLFFRYRLVSPTDFSFNRGKKIQDEFYCVLCPLKNNINTDDTPRAPLFTLFLTNTTRTGTLTAKRPRR